MITEKREVIKLVQRISGKLVSLKVYHFAENKDWLLTYRQGIVVTPTQPNSLMFAYESLDRVQELIEQYRSRTKVQIEVWRTVTTNWELCPEGILFTNRLHRWADFWKWYASREQAEAFPPLDSTYSPAPGTVLCKDITLIERIQ